MSEHDNQEHRPSSADRDGARQSSPPRLGRRTLMMGAAAVGVGAAASLAAGAEPAMAANGGDVLLGKTNKARATTTVTTTKGNGLKGETSADGGIGLYGYASAKNGTGVVGSSNGFGVVGIGKGTNGYGVYGEGPTGGIFGLTNTADQYGVFGNASALARGGKAVYGLASDGYGVYGECADSGFGVLGTSGANGAVGVFGAADGSDAIGVLAQSTAGTALSVDGNATVSGTLSKGGGSFKIDHPLDPASKYLYHSFVESPDMMNVYNGTVALDRRGRARVELPDWFEALNRDFRYQLTPIGAPAPNLHISSTVADKSFGIAGGHEGQEVSWQVTGIRQDAWANAHRIPVEVEKAAEDQGRYLHPELFGKGAGELITAVAQSRSHTHRRRKATTA